ncbi:MULTISPECIES: fimbrial biogenesis chaperone [Serratia]|uniref:fimbrial biogenesis chaperone n=1 Tax=Serratia TaxID=613 RepID=UPI0003AC920E|nr:MULTISPECIES: fimbria/pilus periplasmic chaperone [Serratia]ERK09770.1 Chaperone protein fimC precursor [Serratia fonticola AU-P3(3)]ERK14745.1 Chaperone protein fimC precursor [Serratia fonticola AU-AP2C]ALX94295.1 pilus assembly protein PapD [Serratia fonticola]MBP1000035.1 fimbria/pilus periplasmic chaperone [Serratia fonticola]MBP1005014.1 fimbria/pilus periplasmic chaperone [Serratia fonticola]
MKTSFKKYSVLLMAVLFSSSAFASVIVNGTRVIYPAKQREVTVQLSNNGTSPALIQAWIDEGNAETTPENSKAPFIISPPISRIEPNGGQALRVSLTTSALTQDKESLFWLNVLEIPPAPTGTAADTTPENFLQVAFRTRVKLFYRPEGLSGVANDAPEKLQWSFVAGGVKVKNPTPFYVSFTEINAVANRKKVALAPHGDMLAPGQEKTLAFSGDSSRIADIEYTTINDFGGRVQRSKNQQK